MKFWKELAAQLQNNNSVYLLTVIENHGSSPGRKGFKMLVSDTGYIYGSIGGGVMEFELVEEVKKLLKARNPSIFCRKLIHRGRGTHGSGMICSGEQTVVAHPLNQTHLNWVLSILDCLKDNSTKTIIFSPDAIGFSEDEIAEQYLSKIKNESQWVFQELIGFQNTLYIIGGGHVGLAVTELFQQLNFQVQVFDNREHLNTLEQNVHAQNKEIIQYKDVSNYIKEGNDSYVVIMTNKYTDDKLVLSKLLRKQYKFIGVLGSVAKLKTMWEVLQNEGFTLDELAKVHAPIGLPIKSQTPEEIAVSIAAEIIQVKNKLKP
uniref:XdhC family protein n=1 Tax=Polaribacter sp. TaxID=1920175 RepID=UPI0040471B78